MGYEARRRPSEASKRWIGQSLMAVTKQNVVGVEGEAVGYHAQDRIGEAWGNVFVSESR